MEPPRDVDRLPCLVLSTNEGALREVVPLGEDPGGRGTGTVTLVFVGALLRVAEPVLEGPS